MAKINNFWYPKKSEDFWGTENSQIFKCAKNQGGFLAW